MGDEGSTGLAKHNEGHISSLEQERFLCVSWCKHNFRELLRALYKIKSFAEINLKVHIVIIISDLHEILYY